ncbi:MAG TPA: TlpA disulfide reductase family protein [Steroidobacteraceae bacterium]|jgi:thiol-disulfide isomerase/thioredoxin
MNRSALLLLCLCPGFFTAMGCSSRVQQPVTGSYRATLTLPGGELPFGLEISREGDRYVMFLANGSERTRVPNVKVVDGELQAVFPGYENSMRAALRKNALEGSVTIMKAGGVEQVIPFHATLGATHRFFDHAATDNADVAGRWSVSFTDDDGTASQAVAVFEQKHDRVTGTVMTPTGDHRYLEGQIGGDELLLSTFAGGLPYLYRMQVSPAGELAGEYWQGLKSHEKLVAKRDAAAALADAESLTKMKDDAQHLEFTFRDVDGKPVSLSDARFRGKVVLVTLGGSWCPNCHDEALFLEPFYREYRSKGFEIIALMFERHGEFEKAAAAARGFRDDLGVQYTTLIAGVSDKDEASKVLPTLTGVYGFPTSIFVDRQGKVRRIHTGFTGPATGKPYEEYVVEFRNYVDQLLAEPSGT